jgi:two-component system response regulator HydG
MRRPQVLIVDDKPNMLRLMSKVLKEDADVFTAESGGAAIDVLKDIPIDAVLCDLKMPDMDGTDVLRACKRLRPAAEFILMTAYASVGTAVEALKLGAYDYLTKPFEPDAAKQAIFKALSRLDLQEPSARVADEVLPGLVARSAVMVELAELVKRIADSDVTALVLGETGTGKERVARALHQLSPRASKRFVALNCAAIPTELLESELFGHAKGAFTGANSERKGLFEEANGGTLFLDEIGDMRLSLQAKLTRVLEEGVIRRVGEAKERAIDVRLIAATHRDLEAMVAARSFREDLWYRLNVALLRIPPLRERKDDIELLAQHFLKLQAQSSKHATKGLTHAAQQALLSYDWPGNVRQLRAALERASVVAAGSELDVADLPPEVSKSAEAKPREPDLSALTWAEALKKGQNDVARRYLESVLREAGGHVSRAAEAAGVERESFYRLLRKHGVEPSAFRRKGD